MRLVWVCLLFILPAAWATEFLHNDPEVQGYVTSVAATGAFQVQGIPVIVTPQTKFYSITGKQKTPVATPGPMYVGEGIYVWGKTNGKTHAVSATEVATVVPGGVRVRGLAIVDAAEPVVDGAKLVRADGYTLRITPATTMLYNDSVSGLDKVGTNVWIEYDGVQGSDGVVAVKGAGVWPNEIEKNEAVLKKKREFEPELVEEKDRQSAATVYLVGTNYKKVPAYRDEAMQARVTRIGMALIPAYQKALAEDEPTRIKFRFQLVDEPKWVDAWALPSGIILVPYAAVTRLSTDGEVATMLADNIAAVLEKEEYVHAAAKFREKAAFVLFGTAVGFYDPALGVMSAMQAARMKSPGLTKEQEQSGRVSLWLLKDAGYDVREAPVAWWKLAGKTGQPLEKVAVPERASNLYLALGITFRAEQ